MAFPGKVIFSHIDFSPTYAIVSFMVMINNSRLFKVLLGFNIHCRLWPSQPLGVGQREDLGCPLIGGWPRWPIEPSADLDQASGLLLLNLMGSFSSQQIPALLNVSALLEDAEFRRPGIVQWLQGWWLWPAHVPPNTVAFVKPPEASFIFFLMTMEMDVPWLWKKIAKLPFPDSFAQTFGYTGENTRWKTAFSPVSSTPGLRVSCLTLSECPDWWSPAPWEVPMGNLLVTEFSPLSAGSWRPLGATTQSYTDSKVTFCYFLGVWFLPVCFLIAELSHGHKCEPLLFISRVPTWRRLAHLRSGSCPCGAGLVTWWTREGDGLGGTGAGAVGGLYLEDTPPELIIPVLFFLH